MNTSPHRSNRDWIRAALNRSQWFAEMPAAMREELLAHGMVRHFVNGAHIVEQGCHPDGIYAVLNGQVAFLRQVLEGREFLLNIVGPGFWFADPSVLLNVPMPHTAVARADVQTLFVPATTTNRIRNASVELANHFASMRARRFIFALNAVADATALPQEAYLCQRLAELHAWPSRHADRADPEPQRHDHRGLSGPGRRPAERRVDAGFRAENGRLQHVLLRQVAPG